MRKVRFHVVRHTEYGDRYKMFAFQIEPGANKNITDLVGIELETNKNDKQLLRRLHVKTEDKILEGAEAFLLVWKKIPKYKILYSFFKLPIIFTLFKIGYEIIAYFL